MLFLNMVHSLQVVASARDYTTYLDDLDTLDTSELIEADVDLDLGLFVYDFNDRHLVGAKIRMVCNYDCRVRCWLGVTLLRPS